MPELTGHQDLRSGLRMFWRWKFLFLSFVLGAPLVAYIVQNGKPTTYSSSALVGIDQTTVNTAVISSINGGSFSTSNVLAIAQLVTAPAIADIAAGLLHPPARPDQIAGEVSATGDQNTNFVTVTAVDRSQTWAAEIANALPPAISLNREQSAINELDSAISGIRSQLAHAGRKDASAR